MSLMEHGRREIRKHLSLSSLTWQMTKYVDSRAHASIQTHSEDYFKFFSTFDIVFLDYPSVTCFLNTFINFCFSGLHVMSLIFIYGLT